MMGWGDSCHGLNCLRLVLWIYCGWGERGGDSLWGRRNGEINTRNVVFGYNKRCIFGFMDAKMKRQILFNRNSNTTSLPDSVLKKDKTPPKEGPKTTPFVPKPEIRQNRAKSISVWLTTHLRFKWSGMAKELGLDPGNFSRTIYSDNPAISDEDQEKIIAIIKDYGYAD